MDSVPDRSSRTSVFAWPSPGQTPVVSNIDGSSVQISQPELSAATATAALPLASQGDAAVQAVGSATNLSVASSDVSDLSSSTTTSDIPSAGDNEDSLSEPSLDAVADFGAVESSEASGAVEAVQEGERSDQDLPAEAADVTGTGVTSPISESSLLTLVDDLPTAGVSDLGGNPGNDLAVGQSPFDGITGASGRFGPDSPDAAPMRGGEDDRGAQPGGPEQEPQALDQADSDGVSMAPQLDSPLFTSPVGGGVESLTEADPVMTTGGGNPGNDLAVRQSTFDGITGASGRYGPDSPDAAPMRGGEDTGNQPGGTSATVATDPIQNPDVSSDAPSLQTTIFNSAFVAEPSGALFEAQVQQVSQGAADDGNFSAGSKSLRDSDNGRDQEHSFGTGASRSDASFNDMVKSVDKGGHQGHGNKSHEHDDDDDGGQDA